MVCLRESLPEVRERIQNLADKLGVDYGTAKIILLENNGYDLDKAPNGAESRLYLTLLEHYDGDEKKALIAKTKTYLQPFFDWFGHWTTNVVEVENIPMSPFDEPVVDKNSNNKKEANPDVSKAVDENGEPLIVYHGSNTKQFNMLDFSKSDDGISFFTTSDKHVANTYVQNQVIEEGSPEIIPEISQFDFVYHDLELNLFSIPPMNEFYQFAERDVSGMPDYNDTIDNELWVKLLYNFLDQIENIEADPYLSGKEKAKKLSYYGIYNEDQLRFTKQKIKNDIKFYNKPENNFSVSLHNKQDYIYPLFFKSKNPLIIQQEFHGVTKWHDVKVRNVPGIENGNYKTRELARLAKNKGYDSVIIKNVIDPGPFGALEDIYYTESVQKAYGTESRMRLRYSTLYIAVDSENQIKSIDNRGTFSTTDNRIEYYNAVHDAPDSVYAMSDETRKSLTSYPKQGVYHAKQFMQTMLTSGEFFQDPVLLEIALKLFEKIPDAFEVVFSNDNDYDMSCSGNTITVTLGALRNLNTYQFGHRFMHEIMHPIVRDAAGKGGYLYEAIERVRKEVLSKLTEEERKDLTFYGLTDSKEFASEIFTNPFFRDELVKRYSPKGWRKLLQNILNFFGFKKIANEVAQNSEYIYNEISKIVDNYTGDPKHDLLVGKQVEFYSPNLLNQLEKDAKNEIKKIQMGLKNRLKVLKSAANQDPARMVKLQELIYKYENLLVQGEIQQCFVDFIKSANPVYNSILQKVRRAVNDPSTISNDELVQIKNDFIDFYGPVIKECKDNLFVNGYFDSLPAATKAAVAKNLNLIERAHTEIQSKWGLLMKDKAALVLRAHAEAQGRPTEDIDNYLNDELNQTDSDLNFYSRFIQSAGRVSDIAISTMFRVMSDCNRQVVRFANGVLQDLKTAMDLLGIKRRDLLNFFEKDNKGRSTGYLIRPLNYGLANADYRAFLTSLNEKYGISADEVNGLPDDEFIEYHREKERWLCDHYERKFKSAYYLAYAELSPTTKQVLRDINDEIKRITDTVSSPTGARLQDLSDADYKKLTALYKLKRDLANPYDENGNIKFGDDLKIAEELTNFNSVISGGFSNNYTLQQVIDLIDSKKRSMSAAEFLKWYDRNVVIGYSESFSNWLQSIGNKGTYGAEYISLLKEKNALLKHGKDSATPYVDAAKLTAPVRRRIFQIDQRLSEIRFLVNGPSNGITQNALGYMSNGQFVAVAKIEPTLRYYSDKAIAQSKGQGAFQLWVAENHVDGQPASYYTKLVPVTLSDIEFRLNPMNQELSADSPLMNPAFDFNSNESRQPKVSLYDNSEAYAKATEGNKKAMYDLFVQTMSEANAKLPWLDNQSPYKLPQKTGDMIDYLWRSKRNVFRSLWDYSADAITIRPDDPGYALDNFSAKPGGGQIDFIPTYYVRDLDNPEYISRNLLGIIAEYARMAENYRVKQERQGEFMVIDEALAGRDVVGKNGTVVKQGGRDTRKYKKYHELLNMQLYGRMFKEIVWDLGFFRFKFPIKLWKNTISYATLLGLSWNRNSIVKSFWQAHLRTITEAIGGRYFDSLDLLSAIGQQIMYLPKWFAQLGNPYANDFSIALMQHLNIAREFTLNIEDLQYNRLFRLGSKYGLMGGWSFIDYFVKTPIIKAVAANFRLDPTSGKFMPKHKFINTYYADDRKTGEKEFYKLKTRWLNVITSVNGKIVPKKGYESLADAISDKETINLLTNIGEFITNRIDGKISEEDKTQWMTSIIGSAACMHRWYYIFNLDDNYATRHQYNPMIEDNYEARFLSVAKVMWKGLQNLGIMFLNLFGASKLYKLVESVTMYNFRRSLGHLLTLGSSTLLLYGLIYPFIFSLKAGDDDDDEGFLKNIPWEVKRIIKKILIGSTAAAEGAVLEEYSEYPTVSFDKGFMQPDIPMLTQILQDDVPHTITPAYSLVDTYEAIFSSRGRTLRSGSYAGMTDTQRNIIRAVPGLRNLMDFTNVSPALNMARKNRTPLFWELNNLFKPETKKPERKSKGFEIPVF